LIGAGKLALVAEASDGKHIRCRVVSGTSISDKKGVSLPDTTLDVGALTEKDRRDLDAVLQEEIDWVALSFILGPRILPKSARSRAAALLSCPRLKSRRLLPATM
jgi:pyruvate kinase